VPQRVWNLRRERQPFHTEQGPHGRGTALDKAAEIDSASHRARTRDELYAEAKDLGIRGRSMMTKQELRGSVDRKTGR
jgi:hypothetical protein